MSPGPRGRRARGRAAAATARACQEKTASFGAQKAQTVMATETELLVRKKKRRKKRKQQSWSSFVKQRGKTTPEQLPSDLLHSTRELQP